MHPNTIKWAYDKVNTHYGTCKNLKCKKYLWIVKKNEQHACTTCDKDLQYGEYWMSQARKRRSEWIDKLK